MSDAVILVYAFSIGSLSILSALHSRRLHQQSSRIDLHWVYMKSLSESLDTLKEAIETVDAKVDGKGATDHDAIHTP